MHNITQTSHFCVTRGFTLEQIPAWLAGSSIARIRPDIVITTGASVGLFSLIAGS